MKNKNTLAAQILFASAKAHIDEILSLIRDFKEIRDGLELLGYGGEERESNGYTHYDHDDPPIPGLQLTTGHIMVWDSSDILDEFLEEGPRKRALGKLQRMPMTSEKNRLGKEFGWKCFYCAGHGDESQGPDGRVWHVDHVYPISRGGDDATDNHVLACATCNLDKRIKTAAEYFRSKSISGSTAAEGA